MNCAICNLQRGKENSNFYDTSVDRKICFNELINAARSESLKCKFFSSSKFGFLNVSSHANCRLRDILEARCLCAKFFLQKEQNAD